MRKEMFFGLVFFVGYVYGVNYFIKNIYNKTESKEIKEDIQLESIEKINKIDNEVSDNEVEVSDNEVEVSNDVENEMSNKNTDEKMDELFQKMKLLKSLDQKLNEIKEKIEEIRNNLYNFN